MLVEFRKDLNEYKIWYTKMLVDVYLLSYKQFNFSLDEARQRQWRARHGVARQCNWNKTISLYLHLA